MTRLPSKLAAALLVLLFAFAPSAWAEEPLDLNTATLDDLDALPGIGKAKAQAILDERARRGGFDSVDDLDRVKGIGKSIIEKLRPHVTVLARAGAGRPATAENAQPPEKTEVSRPAPTKTAAAVTPPQALDAEPPTGKLNINLASEEELQHLDGISRANAKIIVAYRKVKGPFRQVAELASVPGLPAKLFQTVQYFVTARADANTVEEAQLVTLGFVPEAARALLRHRQRGKFKAVKDLERVPGLSPDERVKAAELLWFPR